MRKIKDSLWCELRAKLLSGEQDNLADDWERAEKETEECRCRQNTLMYSEKLNKLRFFTVSEWYNY